MAAIDPRRFSILVWSITCLFASLAIAGRHDIYHGNHDYLDRRLANTTKSNSQNVAFSGLSMFDNVLLSGLNLTSTCESALSQTVYCDDNISSLMTSGYVGSFDNSTLTALVCDTGCGTSIAQLNDAVLAGCGETTGVVPGLPFLGLVDLVWSNWNQSCFSDQTTGQNCNGKFTI
jgi:hypothetical protein